MAQRAGATITDGGRTAAPGATVPVTRNSRSGPASGSFSSPPTVPAVSGSSLPKPAAAAVNSASLVGSLNSSAGAAMPATVQLTAS